MFAVIIATILVAGVLAGGMCALLVLSERPPTYRITVRHYHYHDNRSITVKTMPALPPQRAAYELEATCARDN